MTDATDHPSSSPLERDREVGVLTASFASARSGSGGLVFIEGPSGIGKSALLDAAAHAASGAGLRVLHARATELERGFAFGVGLQLFEPVLHAASGGVRDALLSGAAGLARPLLLPDGRASLPAEPNDFSIVHGLYWLGANVAEQQPLAILVDDAHWADEPSLRLCAYLAQRIDELPITLVVAARTSEPGAPQELLDSLAQHRLAEVLKPAPLSEAAIATLLSVELGAEPDAAFVGECARMSGGNPYLLRELVAAAAAEGMQPTAAEAGKVAAIAPEGVDRAVATRLAELPAEASKLARAVAVLGDGAQLRHAAALAGLDSLEAGEAADALTAAGVLRPGERLGFVHPLTAAAVDARLARGARAEAHLRAAELLRVEGAPPERLAVHLLAAPSGSRTWVVDALAEAARRARALGAPQSAVQLLRRALEEPPPIDRRVTLLRELGQAEASINDPAASSRLDEAARLTSDQGERADALRELARIRVGFGDAEGALAAYARAISELNGSDPELLRYLRAEELVVAALEPASTPDSAAVEAILADEGAGNTPAGRSLLASLAVHELYAGAPRSRVLPLADRALAGGTLLADDGAHTTSLYGIFLVLFVSEQLARADALVTRFIDRARRRGSVMDVASLSYSRAWARLIAGRVSDAVDDGQQAVDAGQSGWLQFLPGAYGVLCHALLDAGEVDEAARHLKAAEALGDRDVTSIMMRDARGRVLSARGDHAAAAREFLAAGELAGGQRNPLLFATWRSNAGLALARMGERDRACQLVEEELALAREFGAPRGIAVALRALGIIEGGPAGLVHLGESVRVLDGSEALLERGRSLVEHGAALRRAGRRTEAGRLLGDALEIARAGGAGAIERRANEELAVAGARAERAARRGRDALSPSERRVVGLAADGLSNREIAETLFVTRKAVEWHLRNSYVKLGISSRRDLPAALKVPDQH